MGRLDYSTPTLGKDESEEGAGDRSAYFLKYHGRGDESSSAPLKSTNTERMWARLRLLLNNCLAVSVLSIKMLNIFPKTLIMGEKISAGAGQKRFFQRAFSFKQKLSLSTWNLHENVSFQWMDCFLIKMTQCTTIGRMWVEALSHGITTTQSPFSTFVSYKISSEKIQTVQSMGFHIQRKILERHCAERESSRNGSSGMSRAWNGTNVFFFFFF